MQCTALFENVLQALQSEQRNVSRVVTPSIQASMTPAFVGATNESGTGSFERMKVWTWFLLNNVLIYIRL